VGTKWLEPYTQCLDIITASLARTISEAKIKDPEKVRPAHEFDGESAVCHGQVLLV
jgi:hypothetical protein